ncbi:hypothetical protein DH2020_048400 [Rehmannia glutinosa]|uniref:F-box protein n=1 Tax=Rehmannia glutinosa TaxID=99300 RepID=A0ABR0U5Y6_REHGL
MDELETCYSNTKTMEPSVDVITETSAHVVASIDDLLINIILRLPIKSLLPSELVCKHWNSLISNPGFLESNSAVGLFFQFCDGPWHAYIPFSVDESRGPPFVDGLDFIENPSDMKILQSCNGLLLCCNDWAFNCRVKYYVCNPTTKQYSTLPVVPKKQRGLSLLFDPSRSPYYKIVCVRELRSCRNEHRFQIEVYSSETGNTWRILGEPFAARVKFKRGVYWNGAIHWISSSVTGESIYFNPDNQTVKVMPTPPILDGDVSTRNSYFGESCGHLHYIDVYKMTTEFNVYEMRRDYSEWFVKYQVDVSYEDSFLILQIRPKKFIKSTLVKFRLWD